MHTLIDGVVTDSQRQVAKDLAAQDVSVWIVRGTGRAIAAAFRRYLTNTDSKHIDQGLYRFLMTRMGLSRPLRLVQLRALYRDPVAMLDELEEIPEWRDARLGAHTQDVYTDGLTSEEVRQQLRVIAAELGPAARERSAQVRADVEIALARNLAAKHGLAVTDAQPDPGAGAGATAGEATT